MIYCFLTLYMLGNTKKNNDYASKYLGVTYLVYCECNFKRKILSVKKSLRLIPLRLAVRFLPTRIRCADKFSSLNV